MIAAATTAMGGQGVLAVTMLTSLSSTDLTDTGITAGVSEYVAAMASLSFASGAEGVVCSPGEISTVRQTRPGLRIFTPGVRPAGTSSDDQKRVGTPERASADGADYLVIGRPITRAADPAAAARRIAATVATFD